MRGRLDWRCPAQALPLARHAGVRVLCLAAAGDSAAAVQLANEALPAAHHAAVAAFVCSLHGKRGAQAALLLTGLRLVDQARLRLELHHWVQVRAHPSVGAAATTRSQASGA